jgi:hypothetical protein
VPRAQAGRLAWPAGSVLGGPRRDTGKGYPDLTIAGVRGCLFRELKNQSGPYYVAGVRPTGTVCVPHGAGRDFCVTSLSHGLQNISETVIIAPDGNSFITK